MNSDCPQCDGYPTYMGTLGTLAHWRCRHCGTEWSTTVGEADEDDEADEGNGPEWDGQPDELQEWHDFDPDC
jgi:hypothetical protein